MRALTVLAASWVVCSSAMADGGHGNARGGPSFSAGHSGFSARGRSPGRANSDGFREGGRSMGAPRGNGSGGRAYSPPRASGNFSSGRNVGGNPYGVRPGLTTRPDFGVRPGFTTRPDFHGGPGFSHGPGFAHRPHWNGGYWNGRFWPRVYYRPSFVWFWPVLPAVYSTFWFGGIPYYYVDDVYYTWSPERYGYVVTNPPPAAESTPAEEEGAEDSGATGSASVYVYPRNGQSEEQTSNDRYECHQWAVSQTGFDPTTANGDTTSTGNASDYRRALIACLDARGYSAN